MGILNTITALDLDILNQNITPGVNTLWPPGVMVDFVVTAVVELNKEGSRKGLLVNCKDLNTDLEGSAKSHFINDDMTSIPLFRKQTDITLLTLLFGQAALIGKTAILSQAIGKRFSGVAGSQRAVHGNVYQDFAKFTIIGGGSAMVGPVAAAAGAGVTVPVVSPGY